MRKRVKLLFSHINTGKSINDKLKIALICILRFLRERLPKQFSNFLDSLVHGMIIETDIKIKIRNLEDYFLCSLLHEDYLQKYFNLRSGIFLDVGAHLGKYTLRVARHLDGLVIAVEPERSAFEFLVENIKLNNLKNVIPLNIAAWHKDEILDLFYAPHAGSSTLKRNLGLGHERVRARALDNILNEMNISNVNLVKIDVEGSKYEVLKGISKTLKNSNALIIFEEK